MLLAAMPLAASTDVLPGDVDGSGQVNIADVTELIDMLLNSQTDVDLYPAADADGDGVIGIADVTELIDVILNTSFEDEHDWVDLGLPSGTLWATCNVGAETPEDYGDYFAWGETSPKAVYDMSTYKWYRSDDNGYGLTKYCTTSVCGYNGFTDGKTELDPSDDAATANWGSGARMPTLEQIQELVNTCTWEWTMRNGVKGQLGTGPNGNSIFLPAAGYRSREKLSLAGTYGYYWSRWLIADNPGYAYDFYFNYGGVGLLFCDRDFGHAVRAVRTSQN